jgi:hypothetical protein
MRRAAAAGRNRGWTKGVQIADRPRDRRDSSAPEPKRHFNFQESSCCRFAADSAIVNGRLNFLLRLRDQRRALDAACASRRLCAFLRNRAWPAKPRLVGGRPTWYDHYAGAEQTPRKTASRPSSAPLVMRGARVGGWYRPISVSAHVFCFGSGPNMGPRVHFFDDRRAETGRRPLCERIRP